ncbi:hypothetical protein QVD17_16045 [Tagetes erecta]|uniref:Retrovirus-related Pol polyprotein from transposon TNT 1-94-like beta-barrel domain-containing protein n=1 Tax=Tagetes erecta TaxID=13708 RepID=A0AAD8KW24_TARER|nr:hypothetical protein QVD17_16045 [Tagetes erecta]
MAEDGKVLIEKFDGKDFSWWKMQMDALLCQKDLDVVLEKKSEKMTDAEEVLWNAKDKKARGTITLALTINVSYNIMSETTDRGMLLALSNMYEKPSAAIKVFLMRELFTMRIKKGSLMTEHINNLNSILSRLSSVKMKFDDETRAVLLLSSLPDSWSETVTVVTNSVETEGMTFEKIRDLVLGEDVCRRGANTGSSSKMLHVGRGRDNKRNSGSNKTSEKELNNIDSYSDDDVLLLNGESNVVSWVMDFGASFHATHSSDGMQNVKKSDFGKARLGNGEILDVTDMGDVDLDTNLGTTWTLSNIRIIPKLEKKVVSIGGFNKGSLYLVLVPSGDVTTPVKTNSRIGLVDSRAKRVRFVAVKSRALVNQLEHIWKSERGRGSHRSGVYFDTV